MVYSLIDNIVKQREKLEKSLKGKVRLKNHCPDCYEYDRIKVKGKEDSITEMEGRWVVRMNCKKCGNAWNVYILNDKEGKREIDEYKKRLKRK